MYIRSQGPSFHNYDSSESMESPDDTEFGFDDDSSLSEAASAGANQPFAIQASPTVHDIIESPFGQQRGSIA